MAENDALSLSLDDLIEKNKSKGSTTAGAGRGRSRGTGTRSGRGGGTRPSNNSNGNTSRAQGLQVSIRNSGVRKARGTGTKRLERPAPAEVPRRLEELDGPKGWSHSAFQQTEGAGGGAVGGRLAGRLGTRAGTKLAVSNLDHNVSEQDLNELFSNVGALTSCTIDFDNSGRSLGTAEVLFKKAEDAQTAIQQYNQVALDGKPMGLKLLDSAAQPRRYGSGAARGNAFAQAIGDISGQEGAAAPSRMRSQGGGSGMRSDRVGGGGGGGVRVSNARRGGGGARRGSGLRSGATGAAGRSAEDLDADLDTYMQG